VIPRSFSLTPGKRVLFLTRDPELIRAQIRGELDLRMEALSVDDLLDDLNTDVMTPAWVCFRHDPDEIARDAYAGLLDRGERLIPIDALRDGNFEVIVAGRRKGVGSSRETATQCEVFSGIRLSIAESFAPIHAANNINQGLLMGDHAMLVRLQRGESIALDELTRECDLITRLIIESGGLFAFSKKLTAGEIVLPERNSAPRAMTMGEKILASHAIEPGAVRPGDALIVKVDGGYSHEFTTAQVHDFLLREYGPNYAIDNRETFAVFEDHLIYADGAAAMRPYAAQIETLRDRQREFQRHTGCRDYSAQDGISPGICHEIARESLVDPGHFIQATDSHTCMGGANNALAWGVGATEYAHLVHAGFTSVRVPESMRFELTGALRDGVTAKDVMLHILLHFARTAQTHGRIMEFGGDGLRSMSMDERATLANMATECSARTAIVEADERTFSWLAAMRPGADSAALRARAVRPDHGAHYGGGVHVIDLSGIVPMAAAPYEPTNAMPVEAAGHVRIDIAYGGSCTAGKMDDLAQYHRVAAEAVACRKRVADGVRFYIQCGSRNVEREAERLGMFETFARAGAIVLRPGCGACIGCGPGVSERDDEVTVSAINRNFRGRSGPGQLWLASPLTVATSAFAGRITAFTSGMFAPHEQ
jgi:3-isopropylmalate/(R)-2-methylmalate dehydratase large subunit